MPQNGAFVSVRDQIAAETGSSKNTVERSATFTRTVEALAKANEQSKLIRISLILSQPACMAPTLA